MAKLPRNPRKINIDTARAALRERGYRLGAAKFDLRTQTTSYQLTGPDGKTRSVTSTAIRNMLYGSKARAAGRVNRGNATGGEGG